MHTLHPHSVKQGRMRYFENWGLKKSKRWNLFLDPKHTVDKKSKRIKEKKKGREEKKKEKKRKKKEEEKEEEAYGMYVACCFYLHCI